MCSSKNLFFMLVVQTAFVLQITCQPSQRFFRKDYTYLLSVNNFYKIHAKTRTWAEAKSRCALEGAKLFYPEDANETEGVLSFMTETQIFEEAFVGISDTFGVGIYKTIDGQSIDDVYNSWASGEPNFQKGRKSCVVLRRDGRLNDDRCDKKYPFICKKAFADLKWNNDCDMSARDYVFNETLGKCYKLHAKPTAWTKAFAICNAEQSYLAIIDRTEEADHLAQIAANAPKNVSGTFRDIYHLGFHNIYSERWKTITGMPIEETSYPLWGYGQPDNAGGDENCGSMFKNGKLNDISCSLGCFFICEHDVDTLADPIDQRLNDLL